MAAYCLPFVMLAQKAGYNPYTKVAPVMDTSGDAELVSPDTYFVEVVELKTGERPSKAALLVDSKGHTALLPQQLEAYHYLHEPQKLAWSVLATYKPPVQEGMIATTRRFKHVQTGEIRSFAPSQYPEDGDWRPLEP